MNINIVRVIWHLAWADFLQRIRGYAFFVIVAVTIYVSYLFVPPADANYVTVALGPNRGLYNSAWIGTMFGIVVSVIFSLFAFYLVKNSVERDRQTRVGQILATTPISKLAYVLGKWISHLAVLAAVLVILTLMAIVMQLLRAEDTAVQLGQLAAPIWFIGLPMMALVAGVAILFETIPFLRDSFGNVVYFFFWVFVLSTIMLAFEDEHGMIRATNDFLGITPSIADIQQQVAATDPDYLGSFSIGASGFDTEISVIQWPGISWTPGIIRGRLVWIGVGALLAIFGALPFDRFDPARGSGRPTRPTRKRRASNKVGGVKQKMVETAVSHLDAVQIDSLTPLRSRISHSRFITILSAELRLALKGQPWWWFVGVAGFVIGGLASSIEAGLEAVVLAMIWPVLIWSSMSVRAHKYRTSQLIFSASYPIRRQFLAAWVAGVLIGGLMISGFLLRLAFAGSWAYFFGFVVGILFVPALSLMLGIWSGTSRLFEIVYLVWWYIAADGGVVALNFMSSSAGSLAAHMPLKYLGMTLLLLALAVIGRRRQLQN